MTTRNRATHTVPQRHTLALVIFTTAFTSALLQACAGMPPQNSRLNSATQDLQAAQGNPAVVTLASTELKDAESALAAAQAAWKADEKVSEVDHLAYMATQKIAITVETARQRSAENAVTTAKAQRDEILLSARTDEAATAQRRADTSLLQTQSAQKQTDEARAYAQQLQARLDALDAKQTERGLVVTIGDILFNNNSASLRTGRGSSVDRLGEFLLAYPKRHALIEGYTDSVGSRVSNQQLSEQRAASVRAVLLHMGVADARLGTQGYGENYPVGNNANSDGRQANRRVEVILSDDSGQVQARAH